MSGRVGLRKFPIPSQGKTGWPWTKESKPFPPVMRGGKPWPKISIVTPSYNQGQYLEETIRSVLSQNYPNLQYIIMDGGSTDNSVEIIKKYAKLLTYWVSEKDGGQADAIYKGFEKATGEIVAWINSDDFYLPGAFREVANVFVRYPDLELLIGSGGIIGDNGKLIKKYYTYPQSFNSLLCGGQLFMQSSSFWRRSPFFEVGGFDRSLQFCFDYDMFLRLTHRQSPGKTHRMLSIFRLHNESKSSTVWETVALKEIALLQKRYGKDTIPETIQSEISKKAIKQFYSITRRGILTDFVLDPIFFGNSILSKVRRIIPNCNIFTEMNRWVIGRRKQP